MNEPRHAAGWRRLDARTPLAHCAWLGAPLGSLALTALATGGRLDARAWITLAIITTVFAVITGAGTLTWRLTRYRVTADAIELRTGLFTRRVRAVPLHRVRNVDLTANPVQRLLGLVVLRAGTGGHSGELKLEALGRPGAERLRRELLARAGSVDAAEPVLSTADPRWLRYAPLTFWVFGGVLVSAGAVWRALDGMGIEPWRLGLVRRAFDAFGRSALWLTIPVGLLIVTLLGVTGAVALYAENWWRYRLEWTDDATLRVRRGLLTTRSVSIERARLRGVVLREPLLLRYGGGATVRAVTSGLGNREENLRRSVLLPPAPRSEAVRVCTGVLGEAVDVAGLRAHPAVARRRRVVRLVVWGVVPVTVALGVLGVLLTPVLLWCAAGWLLVSVPVAYALAGAAYRALGHAVRGRWLVVRSGALSGETAVLDRASVLAWTFTDTPFSRRAGLVTATAAVAAGEEGYHVRDVGAGDAVGVAGAVSGEWVREFVVGEG
ncbi:PH domain-containing protein [Streptomyces sp. AV19]|uniref:PH domain-containing protein n=1 Tax=Streptomyces sp. AV19 TaxID=2793068 RepID=UPI0018FE1261|nr:PH domain-containing protein [Streptomyces sp. AV19]MBH1932999.1 PH domain-containing protein [Streptomyces sp. AV19]MDG4531711.1 PH domain-containing protein [Streptomyces sp. AV19]